MNTVPTGCLLSFYVIKLHYIMSYALSRANGWPQVDISITRGNTRCPRLLTDFDIINLGFWLWYDIYSSHTMTLICDYHLMLSVYLQQMVIQSLTFSYIKPRDSGTLKSFLSIIQWFFHHLTILCDSTWARTSIRSQ